VVDLDDVVEAFDVTFDALALLIFAFGCGFGVEADL
jgi:hypothetical protein